MDLPQQHILHEAGAKLEFAYFLNDGMASLVVLTSDGRSVEIAIVGKEGIVGTPLAVGLSRGPHRAVMQIAGSGVRVKSAVLARHAAFSAGASSDMESVCFDSGIAGCANCGLQPSA